jgi:hypothetical protein
MVKKVIVKEGHLGLGTGDRKGSGERGQCLNAVSQLQLQP